MGVLNGSQIRNSVIYGHLIIDPFEDRLVQPASYDLRLGPRVLASPLGPGMLGERIELTERNPRYAVQTGQMVAVMSKESMVIPLDMCSNSFGIRSEFARKGLQSYGGLHLDPDWRGHLIVTLLNIGPEPMEIMLNQPFFTVTFDRLDEPVEPNNGYGGERHYQDDFPEDQVKYILSARTTSLAEIPTLREQIANLTAKIEELEMQSPATELGRKIKPEFLHVIAQGKIPIDDPTTLLGGWPDDDNFEEFLSSLHKSPKPE
ncbi:MAG: hypothetical protein IH872_09570 [Chloroflexi bacterium]|nr:hypothetical protein [Chloroflexota bacterium]